MQQRHGESVVAGRDAVAAALVDLRRALADASRMEPMLAGLASAIETHGARADAPDGILTTIASQAPRLSSAVASLRRDHSALPIAFRSAGGRFRSLLAEIEGLVARLAEHQRQVDHLVYESFDTDIGGDS